MKKNTLFLFTEEETFWLSMTRRNGCWGCRSGYFRFMLDLTARTVMTRQMLQIFQKLQSILTMICRRFICVLSRNRSYDNPVFAYNRPYQLSTCPVTAYRVPERDPSALEGGYARRKVGNCNDLQGESKANICYILCIMFSLKLLMYLNCHFWWRVVQPKTFPVRDISHTVVVSESHWTSFLIIRAWGTQAKCTCQRLSPTDKGSPASAKA